VILSLNPNRARDENRYFGTVRRRDSIDGMRWPRSKVTQAIAALVLGVIASAMEFANFAVKSFNNFYFGPHRAYPYPYADVHSANLALARGCGLVFGLVFVAAFALQRLITKRQPN
jgi:hypothetical protein